MQRGPGREYLLRVGLLVAASTLALTASFVGLVAFVTGATPGLGGRLPLYVFAMAVAFVVAILQLEFRGYDGGPIIAAASAVAAVCFLLVSLGGEGLMYAARNPDTIVASELLFYFLAAGLVGTGLAFWGVRHWREFADTSSGL